MLKHTSLFVLFLSFAVGCPQAVSDETVSECQNAADCEASLEPPCAGCPAIATTLCLTGVCTPAQTPQVDVSVDVMLDRGEMTSDTQSLVYVVGPLEGALGDLTCDKAFSGPETLAPEVNVLLTGYKSVSGGSFHDDIALGRTPEMQVILLVWGTTAVGGEGTWTGQGCLELDLTATLSEDPIITLR